MDTEMRSRK